LKPARVNILYVDIEGGWGGSSRSLYFLIRYLDKSRNNPIVILGKKGPAELLYKSANIESNVFFPIPRTTAMITKNWRAVGRFVTQLIHLPRFLWFTKNLIKSNNIDIVHLNHESLFFIGLCFHLLFNVKIVYHVRTMLPVNIWSKIQVLTAIHTADYLLFITENERDLWRSIFKKTQNIPQCVIHNIAESVKKNNRQETLKKISRKFKVISLMKLSYSRGVDRLVDVGLCLKNQHLRDIVFILCGRTEDEAYEKSIRERVRVEKMNESFLFLGHQKNPEEILSECNVLIRPSREYNPWGRDVIEALRMGIPIIAIGTYSKFVEDGVNGYLLPEFDAEKIAQKIIYLSGHPEVTEGIKRANIEKAKRLFNGHTNASKVEAVYDSILK
jgi:glycosyltransferase involved in cell wall biosynthesis